VERISLHSVGLRRLAGPEIPRSRRPIDPDSEAKTFCADESGSLKFVRGGKGSACFTRGQPLATGSDAGGFTE